MSGIIHYADDLVLCGESLNAVMDKFVKWKNAIEGKDLRVNIDKTKCVQLLFGKKRSVSKVDPRGVCGERVGLVVILFSVRKIIGGFIAVVLMCLGR